MLRQESEAEELSRQRRLVSEPVNCTWTIQVKRFLRAVYVKFFI